VLRGDLRPDGGRPLVFSPFGLGVLDLALGRFIHREATAQGLLTAVPDFFVELDRFASAG
jgi:ornithine cyclodeaminase/alanine dehydrogenase-like protein (mu-crystallin family)